VTVNDVVIVGGGVGGISTASALRTGGFLGRITLVDAGEHPYDRPPLSKDYLSGKKGLADIALQPLAWYDAQSIELRSNSTATAILPAAGVVELATGERIKADRVVFATGGEAARLTVPGADLDAVHVLRSADDARRLRQALLPGARILVVGAGLIGAEVASTALRLGAEVTLVDPLASPLSAAIGPVAADWLHSVHAAKGIRTLQTGITGFQQTAGGIETVLGGTLESFDAVVLGVGMKPNTAIAEAAGLQVDRGVVVDAGQTTSNPAVLAVGDPTRRRVNGSVAKRSEHWEAAQLDGARAAATILGSPLPAETVSWFWTDRHGMHVEAIGSLPCATTTVVRGTLGEPPFALFGLKDGQIVGAVAVDDSNVVRAARRMVDRRTPVDPGKLADPTSDLRKLLRG